MIQLIIDAAKGVSASVYWTKFFLGGSALSLFLTVVNIWNSWVSQPDILSRLKAIGLAVLKALLMSLLGVGISWILAQWWSIPVIGVLLLLLWWWY
jgi:hypothetical protein